MNPVHWTAIERNEKDIMVQSIQVLRGIAALLVVLTHSQAQLLGFQGKFGLAGATINAFIPFALPGRFGVELFFVISGFVMALVTRDAHGRPGAALHFLQKRFIRIFPAYWLWTTILSCLLFFFPFLFAERTFVLHDILLSYILIPYVPSGKNPAPILAVAWTLYYEIYFYILISIGLFFKRSYFIVFIFIFFIISIAILPHDNPIFTMASNKMLLDFFAGFIIGDIYTKEIRIKKYILILCIFLSMMNIIYIYIGYDNSDNIPSFCTAAVLLIFGISLLEQSSQISFSKQFLLIGDASYSIYLSHYIVIPAIGKITTFSGLHMVIPPDMLILAFMCGSAALGTVFYLLTEKPMLSFLRNRMTLRNPA
jgi:peptidoglycan/LPS O-acetylase OafA/YrhL